MAIAGNLNGVSVSTAMPRDYVALLKPRVMSLVIFTALVGMASAPGTINPALGCIAIVCIAVGAGASGALNMWYDADIDAVMQRTARRPVPAGLVAPGEALAFGLTLACFSTVTLGLMVGWLAGGLLAFTIFFYAVVYTMWLKRFTPQNIVIGGAAGAFPPVIGWTSVTGTIDMPALLLFAIIFLWTPPHFWALALFRADDYERARVPMLPNVAGASATRRQIFLYSLLLAGASLLPWLLGYSGLLYAAAATALGFWFVLLAWRVLSRDARDPEHRPAKALFGYSIAFLFLLFMAFYVDVLVAGAA